MPADDVSDLRDVVDAINRLCDTMKTSHYDEVSDDFESATSDELLVEASNMLVSNHAPESRSVETTDAFVSNYFSELQQEETSDLFVSSYFLEPQPAETSDVLLSNYASEQIEVMDVASIVSPEEVSIRTVDPSERWSDSLLSLPLETIASDIEPAAQCEPISEMYYTASSEVSLLSDEAPEKVIPDQESFDGKEESKDGKECVIAGHVAAMRERFESMTRTNTPCPDLMRSSSPSLDVFRNITPSPDRLG
ncbi:uncharacterized protein LOC114354879 [Ostrinia furnacalis]|uniref:uncharacterized protein LOC114354879 n=1 Tax=Ostrinia furnacalis TaxID=93504 RepID=UPI00103A258B|nr:uncharacterized protein LOC114354879 [Ostrinia furnacalis]